MYVACSEGGGAVTHCNTQNATHMYVACSEGGSAVDMYVDILICMLIS